MCRREQNLHQGFSVVIDGLSTTDQFLLPELRHESVEFPKKKTAPTRASLFASASSLLDGVHSILRILSLEIQHSKNIVQNGTLLEHCSNTLQYLVPRYLLIRRFALQSGAVGYSSCHGAGINERILPPPRCERKNLSNMTRRAEQKKKH